MDRRAIVGGARPRWDCVMSIELEPAGSTPGTDGVPYEVYQVGSANLVCLVGQAVLYAPLGAWASVTSSATSRTC
eukprot:11171559-Lingulodinium_polyedra.AAC.1